MIRVIETPLPGLVLVESKKIEDERGSFQRLHCEQAFSELGLPCSFPQSNIAFNNRAGILRGMHFQRPPHQEDKLVRCISGEILDVVVDIRQSSETFGRHFAVHLDAESGIALMVPKGFAHGYLTLKENSVVLYHVSASYQPEAEGGIRWDDPMFAIDWPVDSPILSEKDSGWPRFSRELAL